MRTPLFCTIFAIAVLLPAAPEQPSPRFLKVKEPVLNQEAGDHLLLNLDNIYAMLRLDELQDKTGNLELIDSEGRIVVKLGKLKRGEMKWNHRVVNDRWLMVKFDPPDYSRILGNVKEKPGDSGYLLQLVNEDIRMPDGRFVIRNADQRYQNKQLNYLRLYHLTFSEVPDLAVEMKYPIQIKVGEDIASQIHMSVTNKGSQPATGVRVELLLTTSSQLPPVPIASSENFSPQVPLRLSVLTVDKLDPGQKRDLPLPDTLAIPEDVPPGKYYLAAVADPEGKLTEYSRLDNSILGIIMITFPKLQTLHVVLKGASLVFMPENYQLSIECQGALLSNGKDWRKCRMRPYMFQLRHANWPDYHWEVNTVDRGVWEVRGAEFCQTGGRGRELPTRLQVDGGSRFTLPGKVVIPLNDLELRFHGDKGRVELIALGSPIEYGPAWRICRMKPSLYRFRSLLWPDYFWEVDLFHKTASRVTGVDFQHEGGEHQPLDATVSVEYAPTE